SVVRKWYWAAASNSKRAAHRRNLEAHRTQRAASCQLSLVVQRPCGRIFSRKVEKPTQRQLLSCSPVPHSPAAGLLGLRWGRSIALSIKRSFSIQASFRTLKDVWVRVRLAARLASSRKLM